MSTTKYFCFEDLAAAVQEEFRNAPIVRPSHWQGRDISDRHDMQTYEVLNHSSVLWLPDESLDGYRKDIKPDLPWADEHFKERTCGYPLNPGLQWSKWRMGAGADSFREPDGRFNHNYMERIWPKFAQQVPPAELIEEVDVPTELEDLRPHWGIRYAYGDLNDVVNLLAREPLTRQAFLPMFFPEDTGAVRRQRTPCSLGWHFIMREDQLHLVYYLRSCDAFNHWRNDVYMAVRLLLWVLDRLREKDPQLWKEVGPGDLTTHITSFHCFRANYHQFMGV